MQQTFKKRFIALAAVLLMAVTILAPVTASAAVRTSYKTLEAGTWASKSYQLSTGYTYYKIKVSKAGMLTFSFKTVNDSDYPSIYITDNKDDIVKLSGHKGSYKYINYKSDLKSVAVEAGTYYMEVNSGKCKYTYKAAPVQTNYSIAKATSLGAGTKVTAMFTPKRNYARWFKVSISTAKKISYWSNTSDNAYNIEIFNSRLKKLETVKGASDLKYTTKNKQAKGTYYIRIKTTNMYSNDYGYRFGNVATLKWK